MQSYIYMYIRRSKTFDRFQITFCHFCWKKSTLLLILLIAKSLHRRTKERGEVYTRMRLQLSQPPILQGIFSSFFFFSFLILIDLSSNTGSSKRASRLKLKSLKFSVKQFYSIIVESLFLAILYI